MRVFIKGDFTKKIPFGYRELAGKMWFVEKDGKEIEISHSGNDESLQPLQEEYLLSLKLDKWLNDERWSAKEIHEINSYLDNEYIHLQFEIDVFEPNKKDSLVIASSQQHILTVDERALYIMAIEVAKAIDGQISEDVKKTWLSPEEFEKNMKRCLA